MERNWHIQDDDQSFGPVSLVEVYERVSDRAVKETAWFGLDDEWMDWENLNNNYPDPRNNGHSAPAAPPSAADGPPPAAGHDAPHENVERDAILVLGRRASGKTIFFATMYNMLWENVAGLALKAKAGPDHKMLLSIVNQLRGGEWPAATVGMRKLEFELEQHGRKRSLVALDYSGEDFTRAFVDEEHDSPGAQALLQYVDRAAAVMLLIDPSVAKSEKPEDKLDDNFGMVQAVKRIRANAGQDVPVVLVLTKSDRNRALIAHYGSAPRLVLRHYPALVRTLGKIVIYCVEAVQETMNEAGLAVPKPNFKPVGIEKPLRFCLRELRTKEEQRELQEARDTEELELMRRLHAEQQAVAGFNRKFAMAITGTIILVMCGLVVLIMLRK